MDNCEKLSLSLKVTSRLIKYYCNQTIPIIIIIIIIIKLIYKANGLNIEPLNSLTIEAKVNVP